MVLQLQLSSRNRQSYLTQRFFFSFRLKGKNNKMTEQGYNASIVRDLAIHMP